MLAAASAVQPASAQGLFAGRSCNCGTCGPYAVNATGNYATGNYAAGTGDAGGATGDQLAGAPFDLGEAAPAQSGSMFSMVDAAYIDDARIRTIFRARFDAAYNNQFPDRAEFFYAQCGCFGPQAPGPGNSTIPQVATKVDYQEFWAYYENAFSPRFSAFIDVPFRLVNFGFDPIIRTQPGFQNAQPIPNSGGLSDIQFGLKYAATADPYRYDTIQMRIYTPTGDADRGLGTHHFTIEPAYLAFRQLSDRLRFNGEFRVWVPISDSQFQGQNFAGTVLRYGGGLTYDLYQSCDCCDRRLSAVGELVGWSVLGGLKFNPLPGLGVQSASGDTIVNAKFGLRWRSNNRSVYLGYGRALTSEAWYTDIVRAEYAYVF
jgi:hypothetical protein